MSLLNDYQKRARVHLLGTEHVADAFGPRTNRKRSKLMISDYESLLKSANGFQEKYGVSTSVEGSEDGFRNLVRHTMFEKGIGGELYKVIDSSDVVQVPCIWTPMT